MENLANNKSSNKKQLKRPAFSRGPEPVLAK